MKKAISLLLALALCLSFFGCGGKTKDYVLNEDTFFLVMTNMQYYPEQYLGSTLEFDCFTYELVDVDGNSYICGVRKSSSEYGCTCGRDTIIGFLLESAEPLPEPRNQRRQNLGAFDRNAQKRRKNRNHDPLLSSGRFRQPRFERNGFVPDL